MRQKSWKSRTATPYYPSSSIWPQNRKAMKTTPSYTPNRTGPWSTPFHLLWGGHKTGIIALHNKAVKEIIAISGPIKGPNRAALTHGSRPYQDAQGTPYCRSGQGTAPTLCSTCTVSNHTSMAQSAQNAALSQTTPKTSLAALETPPNLILTQLQLPTS